MGTKKPQLKQCEKKYLATAMVLFEYCAAFAMPMREKTAQLLSFCIELDIKGKNTESNSPNKGLITFDIIFDVIAHYGHKKKKLSPS